ncbi:hypothetical protein BBO_04993 [Beauveria brongniartii RCEF 3172]|uniref:Uncharacterized protein n=1 Tax=Beauveria brongniartii RCEF 3172 TaxID=1081107 RepID=A0A167DFP8_9HYPO|nr:hypothetical protein BBO_04993 [Beauveria brongniartii RCEF 3172]
MHGEPSKMILQHHAPLIPSWTSTPIPSLSFSAGALLALADLGTIARRTAVVGGASWLDALVLAPGLHYQQAADALLEQAATLASEPGLAAVAIEPPPAPEEGRNDTAVAGYPRSYAIRNVAVADYLRRLWAGEDGDDGAAAAEKKTVVVDVRVERGKDADEPGRVLRRGMAMLCRQRRQQAQAPPAAAGIDDDDLWRLAWLSHLLYVLSPLLTLTATVFMVLLGDFWGLSSLLALMLARLLNILSIRQRSRCSPSSSSPPADNHQHHHQLTEYIVEVSARRAVLLRGLPEDVQAVTTRAWLRERSSADSYREAAAKLLVYGVAAFGGNMTQAGSLVLAGLLLASAGLLGLSNAKARGGELRVHGRVARPERSTRGGEEEEKEDLEQGRR